MVFVGVGLDLWIAAPLSRLAMTGGWCVFMDRHAVQAPLAMTEKRETPQTKHGAGF
ncbi:hypothetical protein [Helicobacter canis]|uniref:hypothetical protein n=1 Tax=Helicobacter canis TaxID=29419 RepID=UPI0015F0AB47|nr:hypothetical protein [Helicobacter canis]